MQSPPFPFPSGASLSLGAACLAAALALWPGSAFPASRALIMGIGDYQVSGYDLNGVSKDLDKAREIARSLGVAERDVTTLSDGQLTLDGMRQAFADLVSSTQPDDRVFIYYSGHGGRTRVQRPSPSHCAEALVAQDNRGLFDHELAAYLGKLGEKAEKLVFFLDSCFSGGATSRGYRTPGLLPKYRSLPGDEECQQATNLTREVHGFVPAATRGYSNNYVYIAASRPDEVSYEFPSGGAATQSWRECLEGRAEDSDRSGAVTAEEIRACAQQGIDRRLPEARRHHITLTGNARMTLDLGAADPAPPAEPDAPALPAAPYQALKDIHDNRDGRQDVSLTASKRAYRIGADRLELILESDRAGQAYLFLAGSDGKTFTLLFPNREDGDNAVEAGRPLKLPRPGWELPAQGPAGTDHLLAVVAEGRRNFAVVPSKPEGPYSAIDANLETAAALQKIVKGGRYGSALIAVEEVE
jgi:hypothetical protein